MNWLHPETCVLALVLRGEFLLEAGALAAAIAQVVQLGAAHAGLALNDHAFQSRRAEQEGALYTDAVAGDAPDGEIGIVAAAAQPDDGTFKFLGSLVVAFFDPQVNANGITGVKLRDVGIIRGLNRFNNFVHDYSSLHKNCWLYTFRRLAGLGERKHAS
jgi:hypothetical protein